jgi:hypothetical protein
MLPDVAFVLGQVGKGGLVGDRAPQEGGNGLSSTFFSRAGTPALRKYFWARTSDATCDQDSGTSTFSALNTVEPSGLRISLVVRRNAMSA